MPKQHKILLMSWVLSLGFCIQCSASDEDEGQNHEQQLKNVFSNDDRQELPYPTYPFSAIGRLDSGCTGTLISEQLVLTAAHCLVDNATGRLKPSVSYFRPGLSQGHIEQRAWISEFWFGSYTPETKRTEDFAVIKLSGPVRGYSSIPLSNNDLASGLPAYVALAGYSSDKSAGDVLSFHRTCRVRSKAPTGVLLHDCDATAGVSGAPLMQYNDSAKRYEISGMTVSEFRRGSPVSVFRDYFSEEYANVGLSLSSFRKVVDQILAAGSNLSSSTRIEGAFYMSNSNPRPPEDGNNALLTLPPSATLCPAGNFFINADVIFADTDQLQQSACLESSLAQYFTQLSLGTPHSELYNRSRSLEASSSQLCNVLTEFKERRIDHATASRQLTPHLCSVLTESDQIRRYVNNNYSDLKYRDATVDFQAAEAFERAQFLGRLVLLNYP